MWAAVSIGTWLPLSAEHLPCNPFVLSAYMHHKQPSVYFPFQQTYLGNLFSTELSRQSLFNRSITNYTPMARACTPASNAQHMGEPVRPNMSGHVCRLVKERKPILSSGFPQQRTWVPALGWPRLTMPGAPGFPTPMMAVSGRVRLLHPHKTSPPDV
jgi:hypothetical protein